MMRRTDSIRLMRWAAMLALAVLVLGGCKGKGPRVDVLAATKSGVMSQARVSLQQKIGKQQPARPTEEELEQIREHQDKADEIAVDARSVDRAYVLDRARLLNLMMGDGYNDYAEPVALELNRLLRTQGLNSNKKVASVLLNESVKVWKGEPFEQAFALNWVGMHFAMRGDWDNARTACDNSLFQLRDFGTYEVDGEEREYDTVTLAERMADGEVSDADEESDNGYQLVDSNFVLGYLMTGIANQQLGRQAEADDNYQKALYYNAALEPTIRELRDGRYNTIFVVEYGVGPQKRGTGPDNAIAKFVSLTPSDDALLKVSTTGTQLTAAPAMDVNAIATDLMWNNLEDVRLAKSYIGTALVGAGAATAAYGAQKEDLGTALAGLGVALAGAYMKSQAHVDTRYCEAVPQRLYFVTANVYGPDDEITLEIDGKPGSRLVLTGLTPPTGSQANLHYVRLPSAYEQAPPLWATNARPLYATESNPNAGEIALPYIMGGNCVMPPTAAALRKYQNAGYLEGYTLQDLRDLYIAEGLQWEYDYGNLPGLHVLDGGDSLVAPAPGTTGYARLICAPQPLYTPKSPLLQNAIANMQRPVTGQDLPLNATGPTPID